MISLEGKVAIVTGGASGIGAATAQLLARLGAAVTIADVNGPGGEERAQQLRDAGGRVIAVTTDVGDEDQVERMVAATVAEFGRLDMLHNNAADLELVAEETVVTELSIDVWDRTLRTNLTGPLLGCKHAIPAMLETGGGSIVNTASVSGMRAEIWMTAYAVSKAALIHLTREVALQYGKQGIRCNAISPGLTLSPSALGLDQAVRDMYVRHNMTPYVGQPEDIAPVVAFLLSDEARYVTGEVVRIDGGLTSTISISADYRAWAESAATAQA